MPADRGLQCCSAVRSTSEPLPVPAHSPLGRYISHVYHAPCIRLFSANVAKDDKAMCLSCCGSILRGDVAALYAAVCELFEMYLLHTLRAFADMPIASIVSPTESQVTAHMS